MLFRRCLTSSYLSESKTLSPVGTKGNVVAPCLVKIAMSAAHGGFGSERVPLGGGAAVFERLAASQAFAQHELLLLGAGPSTSTSGTHQYLRILQQETAPSSLSMMQYAKFSRDFEHATTREVLKLKPDLLLAHDVSEGPNVRQIAKAGIPVVTIFHVDVVDIFGRLYLGNSVSPVNLARWYRRARHLAWPQVLKLVFEKQQEVADWGALSVVPSPGAQELLEACYPGSTAPVRTIGWGAPEPRFQDDDIIKMADQLRKNHRIPSHHRVILTLSRLSPEKAQHRILEAIMLAEKEGKLPRDLTLVIAGAPAFMEGKRHAKKLRRLAQKINTQVVFPGHVGGLEKTAWYEMATLFVVNSLHESYGLTTLEAMQRGCPVVAVQSFGTSATVSPDVGVLIPKGPELLRRLLGTLLLLLSENSRSMLQQMALKARQKAGQETFQNAALALCRSLEEVHHNNY